MDSRERAIRARRAASWRRRRQRRAELDAFYAAEYAGDRAIEAALPDALVWRRRARPGDELSLGGALFRVVVYFSLRGVLLGWSFFAMLVKAKVHMKRQRYLRLLV